MDKPPYVGEIGRCIKVDCQTDLASATDPYFLVLKPSGVVVVWTSSTFAINGVVRGLLYPTKAKDLNEPGVYKIHPVLTLGDWTGPVSDVILMTVRSRFA
jgi:hypothetical protein